MKFAIILGLVFSFQMQLCSAESFMSNDEYAQMIYKNPRGIGCHHCHGERGEEYVIASYEKEGEYKEIKVPRINNVSKKRFYQIFEKKSTLMPEYFLTDEEKAYLYYYLIKQNKTKRN